MTALTLVWTVRPRLRAITAAERLISFGDALIIFNGAITILVSAILFCHCFVHLLSQSDTSRVGEIVFAGKTSDCLPVLLSFGGFQLIAKPIQSSLIAVLTYFWKHFIFLFRHVVFHVFHQLFQRGAKLFAFGIKSLNLFQQCFDFLMLFQGFFDHVFQLINLLHLGIEDGFLDVRMDVQLGVDLVEYSLPLLGVFRIIDLIE
ncbi:MAG TPA: hypothetical protein VFY96_11275 [Candidatus Binatia bacterium]|nr:hypothetical protein [Candidatus Binatia bacterium]